MERVRRIELPSSAWKAVALPLSYTRTIPPLDGSPQPKDGGGGRIRTYVDLRRQIYSLLPLTTRPPHLCIRCGNDRSENPCLPHHRRRGRQYEEMPLPVNSKFDFILYFLHLFVTKHENAALFTEFVVFPARMEMQ